MEIPLVFVIEHRVPAVDDVSCAAVLQHSQDGGDKQSAGNAHPQHSLQGQEEEIPEGEPPIPPQHTQEEIYEGEGDLAHEEVIIHKAASRNRQGKKPPAAGCHVFVQGRQQQGEEHNGFVEMVKENIIDGKPRKGIEDGADEGGVRGFCIAVQVNVPGEAGAGKLQDEQRPHHVLHPLRGEGDGEPEEGAA